MALNDIPLNELKQIGSGSVPPEVRQYLESPGLIQARIGELTKQATAQTDAIAHNATAAKDATLGAATDLANAAVQQATAAKDRIEMGLKALMGASKSDPTAGLGG